MPTDIPRGDRDDDVQEALAVVDDALYEGDPFTLDGVSDEVLDEVDAWANDVQLRIAQARRRRKDNRDV